MMDHFFFGMKIMLAAHFAAALRHQPAHAPASQLQLSSCHFLLKFIS
jgi:hypothetical protein